MTRRLLLVFLAMVTCDVFAGLYIRGVAAHDKPLAAGAASAIPLLQSVASILMIEAESRRERVKITLVVSVAYAMGTWVSMSL